MRRLGVSEFVDISELSGFFGFPSAIHAIFERACMNFAISLSVAYCRIYRRFG
jgi:hypothetical protein